jgi:Family of unknown function (DUF6035)
MVHLTSSKSKVEGIILEIKRAKENKPPYGQGYEYVTELINEFDGLDFQNLSDKLNSLKNNIPAINYWLRTEQNTHFLKFILGFEYVRIDVNNICTNQRSALIELFENPKLKGYYSTIVKLLFKQGYHVNNYDELYFENKTGNVRELFHRYKLCSGFMEKKNLDIFFDNPEFFKVAFIIQSAYLKKPYFYNMTLVQIGNLAIECYPSYFLRYIEPAFKYYGAWDLIVEQDKKKSFINKVQKIHNDLPEQNEEFENIFYERFEEVFNSVNRY